MARASRRVHEPDARIGAPADLNCQKDADEHAAEDQDIDIPGGSEPQSELRHALRLEQQKGDPHDEQVGIGSDRHSTPPNDADCNDRHQQNYRQGSQIETRHCSVPDIQERAVIRHRARSGEGGDPLPGRTGKVQSGTGGKHHPQPRGRTDLADVSPQLLMESPRHPIHDPLLGVGVVKREDPVGSEEGLGASEGLASEQIAFEPEARLPRDRGQRVWESEQDQVVAAGCPLHECPSVGHVRGHPSVLVGPFGIQLEAEGKKLGIDLDRVHLLGAGLEGKGDIVSVAGADHKHAIELWIIEHPVRPGRQPIEISERIECARGLMGNAIDRDVGKCLVLQYLDPVVGRPRPSRGKRLQGQHATSSPARDPPRDRVGDPG